MNVIDEFLRQAAALPDKVAVRGPVRGLTYRRLAKDAGAVGAALAQRGIGRGDVVAIKCEGVDYIVAVLGVAWTGAAGVALIAVPPDRVQDTAKLCGVKLTIDRETLAQLMDSAAPAIPVADCAPDDVWRIGFSSGTTGDRKVMTFTHGDTVAKSKLLASVPEIQGECTLVNLGVALTFAAAYWLRELSAGKTVLIAFTGPAALNAIEKYDVDLVVSSPGNALRLIELGKLREGGLPKIRTLMLGGAPVTPPQRALLRAKFCDNLYINYGATEVGMVALLTPALMDEEPGCAGRLMPWVDAQVSEEGLLRLRSPMMASGYLLRSNAPEWDRQAFDGGWFQSRDRAHISEGGLVFLAARKDDVINFGGNKLDPSTVESIVTQWPGVFECAVLPFAAENGSQALAAFVVADGAIDEPALRAHCRGLLDAWKVPKRFVQVDELPRNDAGKVMRSALASRLDDNDTPGAAAAGRQ